MTHDYKALRAAKDLEDIALMARHMAVDLNESTPNTEAYARVYWLRRRLGQVVANLGAGTPDVGTLQDIADEYEDYLN